MRFYSSERYSFADWQQIQKKGKYYFVLTRGSLFLGGLLAAGPILYDLSIGRLRWQTIVPFVTGSVFGFFAGLRLWDELVEKFSVEPRPS